MFPADGMFCGANVAVVRTDIGIGKKGIVVIPRLEDFSFRHDDSPVVVQRLP